MVKSSSLLLFHSVESKRATLKSGDKIRLSTVNRRTKPTKEEEVEEDGRKFASAPPPRPLLNKDQEDCVLSF